MLKDFLWLTSSTWEKAAAQTEKYVLLQNIWKYIITDSKYTMLLTLNGLKRR